MTAQVEQLFDDGTHPAIQSALFTVVDVPKPGAMIRGCPACSRSTTNPAECDVCILAGTTAGRML